MNIIHGQSPYERPTTIKKYEKLAEKNLRCKVEYKATRNMKMSSYINLSETIKMNATSMTPFKKC